MDEMINNFKDILSQSISGMNKKTSTGSPYFFQGNYRMMYFPHKYLRDQYQYKVQTKKGIPYRKPKKVAF